MLNFTAFKSVLKFGLDELCIRSKTTYRLRQAEVTHCRRAFKSKCNDQMWATAVVMFKIPAGNQRDKLAVYLHVLIKHCKSNAVEWSRCRSTSR